MSEVGVYEGAPESPKIQSAMVSYHHSIHKQHPVTVTLSQQEIEEGWKIVRGRASKQNSKTTTPVSTEASDAESSSDMAIAAISTTRTRGLNTNDLASATSTQNKYYYFLKLIINLIINFNGLEMVGGEEEDC